MAGLWGRCRLRWLPLRPSTRPAFSSAVYAPSSTCIYMCLQLWLVHALRARLWRGPAGLNVLCEQDPQLLLLTTVLIHRGVAQYMYKVHTQTPLYYSTLPAPWLAAPTE